MTVAGSRRSTPSVVVALGTAQTIAWASTYYLPAVLATPMARDVGVSPVAVFAAFSAAMVLSAVLGPFGGALIDRRGGRGVLVASNLIFACGLSVLAVAQSSAVLFAGWLVIGLGMAVGLYKSAFATLAGIYGRTARSPITGITLIAGFASTVGWPLSAFLEARWGWRTACLGWAALHVTVALPLNAWLPTAVKSSLEPQKSEAASTLSTRTPPLPSSPWVMPLLGFVFGVTWFTSTAMAAHLPRLLEAAGASAAVAVAAGALIGPAQVGARVLEYSFLQKFHPLLSTRLATLAHPLGALLLIVVGGPAAFMFAVLHGAGNGILTISKGTLPLALFGPAGFGLRQGLLSGPGRAAQAVAPLSFGYALERLGADAIWLTFALGCLAFLALLFVRAETSS